MKYFAVYIPDKTPESTVAEYYMQKTEALAILKECKNARLKEFSRPEDAIDFHHFGDTTLNETASNEPTVIVARLPKSAFTAPSSQKLVEFRKHIEQNNLQIVEALITSNPRFLISSGDMPTVLKEGPRYNALHVAAISGHANMCRLILETIKESAYIELLHGQRTPSTDEVAGIILDMYLNTPDKSRGETPLHFAAKYGSVSVVKQLMSYTQCKSSKNKDGALPIDIICSRANSANNTPEVAAAIRNLLMERYFVPVLRSVDECVMPIVGEPFSSAEEPTLATTNQSPQPIGTCSPVHVEYKVMAYAGPMELLPAKQFALRWRTPPRLLLSPLNRSRLWSPFSCSPLRTSTPQRTAKAPRRLDFQSSSVFDQSLEDYNSYNSSQSMLDTTSLPDCWENSHLESTSYQERTIRIKNHRKGLETIGRTLASQNGVEWNEYWDFLGDFANLATADGLKKFESILAERQKPPSAVDELQASMATFTLEETNLPVHGNKLTNSYACLVKTLQVFVNRFANIYIVEYSPASKTNTLPVAMVKLINTMDLTINSYRKDKMFVGVNFLKPHSVFAYLLVNHIIKIKRQDLLARLKENAALSCKTRNLTCIMRFIRAYSTDLKTLKFPAEDLTETSCRDLWEHEERISECVCQQNNDKASNDTMERMNRRRKQRSTMARTFNHNNSSDSEYWSCTDGESSSSEYCTPPSTPPGEVNALFIGGTMPDKNDTDAWVVLAAVEIDKERYPHVHNWHRAMKSLNSNESF
ncbi:hypothetical protein AND_003067 [Anopheles darlingi]|uniref:ANKLE2 third alpha/beta domain-containing protein n=1 Tax=Anopheles darlingi TaxID=43151 RepID=W5JPD1_ANODA|nr:ankyrin repeat and LEM domain-containing protein 2 homolog [Anopheles darlingi]ETN65173.1 hypothetical protein AND_003067 [Anopheles darlingi]